MKTCIDCKKQRKNLSLHDGRCLRCYTEHCRRWAPWEDGKGGRMNLNAPPAVGPMPPYRGLVELECE